MESRPDRGVAVERRPLGAGSGRFAPPGHPRLRLPGAPTARSAMAFARFRPRKLGERSRPERSSRWIARRRGSDRILDPGDGPAMERGWVIDASRGPDPVRTDARRGRDRLARGRAGRGAGPAVHRLSRNRRAACHRRHGEGGRDRGAASRAGEPASGLGADQPGGGSHSRRSGEARSCGGEPMARSAQGPHGAQGVRARSPAPAGPRDGTRSGSRLAALEARGRSAGGEGRREGPGRSGPFGGIPGSIAHGGSPARAPRGL